MKQLKLFHGSQDVVREPCLAKGNPRNDYGRGFYCTPDFERALKLGNLGEQTVLVSEKAFGQLSFVQATVALAEIHYPRFLERDIAARNTYRSRIARGKPKPDDLFALDILRMKEAELDARVQRISR